MKITDPGIYEMSAEDYHADPCPTPSLSAGMINDILKAPAVCFENSRRLNPNYEEPEGQDKFTIGSVAHVMFLEPELFGQKVVVCPFDDWRKSEAKALRDMARDMGKTPILRKHMDKVRKAREAFMAHGFVRNAFANGYVEQSLFWRHKEYGFWCRARPDFIAATFRHLNDYKATANASPANFGRHAYNMGYHRRAAWYLDGIEATNGNRPDHYWFCNQEIKAPYLTSVVELNMQAIEDGRAENDLAASLFARCLETNDWYGYRDAAHLDADRAFQVGLPPWACMEIDQRLGRNNQWPAPARRVEMPQEEEVE